MLDAAGADGQPEVDEEGNKRKRHWDTAHLEHTEHEELDQEELGSIKERLENKLLNQQGVAVNMEDPVKEEAPAEESQEDEAANKTATITADPLAELHIRQHHNMIKDKKGKYHQRIIGQGLSKEVWNEKEDEYESSFKAYVRQQKENSEEKSMFVFELEGKDNELVMNKNNSKVMWTLAICALIGGLIAGLAIRYLMRTYFPQEEQATPIINTTSTISPGPSDKSMKRHDTERESFPMRSTKGSFELS